MAIKNQINTEPKKKLNRKKFFLQSGAAALGIFAVSKIPFKLFEPKKTTNENHIKISPVAESVARKNKKEING